MEKGIDPHRILGRLITGDDYMHSKDNHVDYYMCKKDEEGNRRCGIILWSQSRKTENLHRFQKVEPKIFRDLIQVEVPFITIFQKGGKQTFKVILRTIALVNKMFAKVSNST